MLKKVAFVALAGLTVASTGALAGTASDTMTVTATITASCSITANDLNFGSLTSTNTGTTDVATSVDVTCTADSPFNVGIDYGVNTLGFTTRRMASGGNFLTYDVYKDNTYITAFGPVSTYNTANNFNSPLTGNSGTTNIPIYGRILQQSTPASGSYSDTLTVSVNY
jgi:spore coat protein U-like protein